MKTGLAVAGWALMMLWLATREKRPAEPTPEEMTAMLNFYEREMSEQ